MARRPLPARKPPCSSMLRSRTPPPSPSVPYRPFHNIVPESPNSVVERSVQNLCWTDRYRSCQDGCAVARPRTYETHAVLVAAKEAFWSGGYQPTSIEDLEGVTGLGRSSLYVAFGTKQALFDAALAEYEESFLTPLLATVEATDAGLREAAGFFTALAVVFGDPGSRRGCLAVNSIAELAGREPA